ncbi:hypothetical protein RJT34_22930 [Clitoria ternatea]|uniref:Transmembrane protein n=1 Tax=Clitoria ternatea TaxID=43366 RepID=A0AAN9FMN3_CLITE
MAKLKPYTCTISDHPHPLPFPISKINPNFLRLSQSHSTPSIVCARRRWWSQPPKPNMLHLASTIAFNLKILPEPLNSLAGEISRGDWNGVRPEYEALSRFIGCWRGKLINSRKRRNTKKKKKKTLVWFVLVLVCVAGLWSWRVHELEVFLRALSFCLAGVSLVRLWWGKKAVKEWILGFFFGIVLILSFRLGKEDLKFWVQKLANYSPVVRIASVSKNRIRRKLK